jgi:hypothetical protein
VTASAHILKIFSTIEGWRRLKSSTERESVRKFSEGVRGPKAQEGYHLWFSYIGQRWESSEFFKRKRIDDLNFLKKEVFKNGQKPKGVIVHRNIGVGERKYRMHDEITSRDFST